MRLSTEDMIFSVAVLLASILVVKATVVDSAPTAFASTNLPDVKLRFVSDSGVCETTPGVHQISGYIDVGTNMSMVRVWCSEEQLLIIFSVVLVF